MSGIDSFAGGSRDIPTDAAYASASADEVEVHGARMARYSVNSNGSMHSVQSPQSAQSGQSTSSGMFSVTGPARGSLGGSSTTRTFNPILEISGDGRR